jgi:hypothetical protein
MARCAWLGIVLKPTTRAILSRPRIPTSRYLLDSFHLREVQNSRIGTDHPKNFPVPFPAICPVKRLSSHPLFSTGPGGNRGCEFQSLASVRRHLEVPPRASTEAEEPSGFHFAVTHVSGLFCNASAKYAQLRPSLARARGTPSSALRCAALVQTSAALHPFHSAIAPFHTSPLPKSFPVYSVSRHATVPYRQPTGAIHIEFPGRATISSRTAQMPGRFPLAPLLHLDPDKLQMELRPGFKCNNPRFKCHYAMINSRKIVENKQQQFRDLKCRVTVVSASVSPRVFRIGGTFSF